LSISKLGLLKNYLRSHCEEFAAGEDEAIFEIGLKTRLHRQKTARNDNNFRYNKNFVLYLAILCALLFASCASTKETTNIEKLKEVKPITSTFKLLSINTMHQLQDLTDVKKFASWIQTTGAEVVAVQQIERATESKPGFDAVTELAKRLDMRSFFGKSRYYQGWDSGNALFSLYPIQQTFVYNLPVGKGKVRRSLAYGVVDTGLRSVGFGSTDLDDEVLTERIKQVYEIISVTESMKEYPTVVAGIFGEPANGKSADKMKEKFSIVNELNDEIKNLEQHAYVPTSSKMSIVSAEKVKYGGFTSAGVLVTIEMRQ